jgi:hypothetical protein
MGPGTGPAPAGPVPGGCTLAPRAYGRDGATSTSSAFTNAIRWL